MIAGCLTGSRVYGLPRDDSDLDLCLLVTRDELDLLRRCSDCCGKTQGTEEQETQTDKERNYPPNGRVLRFGKLNVLCFVHNDSEIDFFSFALGTEILCKSKAKGTENRALAVDLFQTFMNAVPTAKAEEIAVPT